MGNKSIKLIFDRFIQISHEQEEKKVSRVYNFSAGPAVLPEEVLKEAADEMLDYQGSGMSVMEMSHRSKTYDHIIIRYCSFRGVQASSSP